jgi:hypothetical protein
MRCDRVNTIAYGTTICADSRSLNDVDEDDNRPFGHLGPWAASSGVRDVFSSIAHVFTYDLTRAQLTEYKE